MNPSTRLFRMIAFLTIGWTALSAFQAAPARNFTFGLLTSSPARQSNYPFQSQDLLLDPSGSPRLCLADAIAGYTLSEGKAPLTDLDFAMAITTWANRCLDADGPTTLVTNLRRDLGFTTSHPELESVWSALAQNLVSAALFQAAGFHVRLVDVDGLTGLEYFSWQAHRWIWSDAIYGETYVQDLGSSRRALGVLELQELTQANQLGSVSAIRIARPSATTPATSYLTTVPSGFNRYAPYLVMDGFGSGQFFQGRELVVCGPISSSVPRPIEKPLGVLPSQPIASIQRTPSAWSLNSILDALTLDAPDTTDPYGLHIKVKTWLPYAKALEIQWTSGGAWVSFQLIATPASQPQVSDYLLLPWHCGIVQIRATDTLGNHSQVFSIRVD